MHIKIKGHQPIVLQEHLLNNLRTVHGVRVDVWLREFPHMLRNLLDELDARIVPGDPPLSYHLVLFAERSGGEEIVIKCTVHNDEQPPELAAAEALSDADIGPRLLWFDLERGVMVMERIQPGETMTTALPSHAEDAAITREIATLSARMSQVVDIRTCRGDLVPVRRYTIALDEIDHETPLWLAHQEDIERAVNLRDRMLDAPDHQDVFLHGDLHHYNVLSDELRGWRVIDPKGLVGPRGYEFGALTYNPVGIQHHPDLRSIERQRVDIWSETTGLPWETVRSWGYVAAVLSACWSGQGGGMDWQDGMKVALALRDL